MSKHPGLERLLLVLVALPFVVLFAVTVSGTIRIYRNTSGGMEPTLPQGSRIIAMRTRSLSRGDIVTFDYPLQPETVYVKRVVALGGDTVEIRAKRLFVNGREVAEPYAIHLDSEIYPAAQNVPEPYRSRDNLAPRRLPAGTFFVLGDNRDRSSDSRYWGTVPQGNLRGRVAYLFSWSRGFWKP